jgi:hypothetical protein
LVAVAVFVPVSGAPSGLCLLGRASGLPANLGDPGDPNRLPTEMATTMMIYSIANERL